MSGHLSGATVTYSDTDTFKCTTPIVYVTQGSVKVRSVFELFMIVNRKETINPFFTPSKYSFNCVLMVFGVLFLYFPTKSHRKAQGSLVTKPGRQRLTLFRKTFLPAAKFSSRDSQSETDKYLHSKFTGV